jgi:hypothetical protein
MQGLNIPCSLPDATALVIGEVLLGTIANAMGLRTDTEDLDFLLDAPLEE